MTEGSFHFEDFKPGQRFCSPEWRMEAGAIKAFAAEFDPQPQHTDERAAAEGRFGGLIASGWHTAALTMRLLMTGGMPPVAGGTVGAGVEKLNWPRPVRPGDLLSVTTEILEARVSRSRPAYGVVRFHAETQNERGEMVQEMTSTMMVPRRPGAR